MSRLLECGKVHLIGKLVALQKGLASRFVRPLNLQKRDAPKQAVKVEVKSKAMR